jgi:hypothetical protein
MCASLEPPRDGMWIDTISLLMDARIYIIGTRPHYYRRAYITLCKVNPLPAALTDRPCDCWRRIQLSRPPTRRVSTTVGTLISGFGYHRTPANSCWTLSIIPFPAPLSPGLVHFIN